MKLSKLLPAESAVINEVDGNDKFRRRLLELGFTEGELIHKLGIHGVDQSVYRVRGAIYSLRQSDVDRITVSRTDKRG